MADTSGMADIRGLNIDKLAKGFADEDIIFKRLVQNSTTNAREIRWYQKTSGFITGPTTTAITASRISNVAFKAQPVVAEQSWTRNTSYVRKYFVESPTISEEDIKDSDIDVLATNVRDLVKAVGYQVDSRIFKVLTETTEEGTAQSILSGGAVGSGWDDTSNGNPIADIISGMNSIRNYGYNPMGGTIAMHPNQYKDLLNYIITVKGSSIPNFASEKVSSGKVMELLGLNVIVSTNVTAGFTPIFCNQRAATWKSFMPITSTTINDPGIGRKIRVWEEGECILTDPKAVCLIWNTA